MRKIILLFITFCSIIFSQDFMQNIESLQSVFTQFLGVDSKNFNLILPNLNDSKMYLKNAEFIESSFDSRPEMRRIAESSGYFK